jgi:hypothetical protein
MNAPMIHCPCGESVGHSLSRSAPTGQPQSVRSETPMAKFRRAFERRLAYPRRFLRHYQHRRQIGCTPAVAFRSARQRMRQPHP